MTKARERILAALDAHGGKAAPVQLGYPRSDVMHALWVSGFVQTLGPVNAWGDPDGIKGGMWFITTEGRRALAEKGE